MVERAASWTDFYIAFTLPQAQRQLLNKQQFSCTLLRNGNFPGNDMACVAISPHTSLAFPHLCRAQSVRDASFECWDERPQDFWGKDAPVWAENMDRVPEGSSGGR